MINIKFAKLAPNAKIPTKRDEDMGYDVYPCFDGQFMEIEPHETKLIPTCIASAFNPNYGFIIKERGSTGSKGIAVRAGVIDSGYRNPWFVALTNTTNKRLYISKMSEEEIRKGNLCPSKDFFVYPYEKAIAQAVLLPVPITTIEEVSYEELKNIKSERGTGSLGSSGK